MEDPVRLVCPECDTAYRVKKLTLGKAYQCKKCGTPLLTAEEAVLSCPQCGARTEPTHVDVSRRLHCGECAGQPALTLLDRGARADTAYDAIATANQAASVSAGRITPPPPPETSQTEASPELGEVIEHLEKRDSAFAERLEAMGERWRTLEEKVDRLATRFDDGVFQSFGQQMREAGDQFMAKLEEYRSESSAKTGELRQALAEQHAALSGSRVDVDGLIAKIAAGLEEKLRQRDEAAAAAAVAAPMGVDAEVDAERLARLESVVDGITRAAAGLDESLARLPDHRDIAERVAEEVGRGVEERVVGPVTQALARQAPEILSQIQDEKLVEMVARSVREAQRPLLREIVSGGRGVPLWLFASLLIPLLLILGYLFLPGELGIGGGVDQVTMREEIARQTSIIEEEFTRLASQGVPMPVEDEERLKSIEGAVNDMYENAWAQVKNSGNLEAEVKNLRRTLTERDQLISEYDASLQKQSRRIRAYEIQLTRLGISPDAVPDSEGN